MKTGKSFTNIETKHDINDFETYMDSGMFFFACESEKMDIFFVPQIGPAPKWCSFLENITEELEETKNYSVYEDYKFLTNTDLEQIGGADLIGTRFIKPYMHGYFMDWKLYKKLKTVSDPFAYEKYLEDRKQDKLTKMLGDRIIMNRNKKLKVNSKFAEEIENKKDNDKDGKITEGVLTDSRFDRLFKDKNFEIDYASEQYRSSHPSRKKNLNLTENQKEETNDAFEKVEEKNSGDKIVNPELIRLKEQLLAKKRRKIDKLYGNKDDMEKSLDQRVKKNTHEEGEFELMSKINKIENMSKRTGKVYKPKITQRNLNSDGKRILANRDKLALAKFR